MGPVIRAVLSSRDFDSPSNYFARYSWPVEYVARALKEIGPAAFPLNTALSPLSNMGQQLFEPPDVAGWERGTAWFSTAAMLARMNFASTLVSRQRDNIARAATGNGSTPQALLSFYLDRVTPAPLEASAYDELLGYLRASTPWTGSECTTARQSARPAASDRRIVGVSAGMRFSRREFVRGGVAAFSVGFAAPRFLCDIALAQGSAFRNLVVVYLAGGNDSLSTRGAVSRRVLPEPPPDARGSSRAGAANRHRFAPATNSDCTRG